MNLRLILAVFSAVVLVGSGWGDESFQRLPNTTLQLPQTPPQTGFYTERAFGDLTITKPIAITTPPGETNRLFVIEQPGRIVVITNLAQPNRTVFLDIASRVVYGGEQGLLGLAFHPDYQKNGLFYIFYTTRTTTGGGQGLHERLARFQVSPADPNRALEESEVPMINQFDRAANHNGGDLHFGPDGYLYVILGDEGAANDSFHNSQRIDKNFFAGMLRIDVDKRPGNLRPNPHPSSTGEYAIPADNPFVGATAFNGEPVDPEKVRTEFWAVGLRNTWRFSFDSPTGDLYGGDVGQDRWESVFIIKKGGNYGWNYREGNHLGPRQEPPGFTFTPPIFEYGHGNGRNQGNCLTGGVVYRGKNLPALFGAYVFADYVDGNIWSLNYDGTQATNVTYLADNKGISAFGLDPRNGDVLIADHLGDCIKRLAWRDTPIGTPFPPTLADTGAFKDLATLTPNEGIVAYNLNVPFWSDNAIKTRWFAVPDATRKINFNAAGNWKFPVGSVWIKHFEMELTNGVTASRRRLETRFVVRDTNGVYGVTYRWDNDQKNATLVANEGADEPLPIWDHGKKREQIWHYPSRTECLTCHTPQGGYALGFTTAQLNRDMTYGTMTTNQLAALSHAGYLAESLPEPAELPRLAQATETNADLTLRVRSYLAANCAYCHLPGGTAPTFWDARLATPLDKAGLINGPLNDNKGNPNSRVIMPGSPENSQLLARISRRGPMQMPPLASNVLDEQAIQLVTEWIRSLK